MQIPITATEPERVWLQELYRRLSAHQPIDHLRMRIELRDRLPKDFRPSQVNRRFLHGDSLSLLGILAIDPQSSRIQDTERVILAIRNFLIENPQRATRSIFPISPNHHMTRDNGASTYSAPGSKKMLTIKACS